jgi:hypothetical protein
VMARAGPPYNWHLRLQHAPRSLSWCRRPPSLQNGFASPQPQRPGQQALCLQTLCTQVSNQSTLTLASLKYQGKEESRLTESKLFECTSLGLRIEDVDEYKLKEDPAAVDCKELPRNCIQGHGVDIAREEAAEFSKELLDSDATAAFSVGEELDKVSCRMLAECSV